jgi:hypothetical protein
MDIQNYVVQLVVNIRIQYGEGFDVVCTACSQCVVFHIKGV